MTSDFDDVATRAYGDWHALVRSRAHVLVTASMDLLAGFGSACARDLEQPIAWLSGGEPLHLISSRTAVLTNVHLLSAADQRTLASWMRGTHETQVVALTPVSLFARVRTGGFDRDLFYRLNAVHLDLTDPSVWIGTPRT